MRPNVEMWNGHDIAHVHMSKCAKHVQFSCFFSTNVDFYVMGTLSLSSNVS